MMTTPGRLSHRERRDPKSMTTDENKRCIKQRDKAAIQTTNRIGRSVCHRERELSGNSSSASASFLASIPQKESRSHA